MAIHVSKASKSVRNIAIQSIAALALSTSIFAAFAPQNAAAQSEVSLALSTLPVASVVVTGSAVTAAAGAVSVAPSVFFVAGAVLTVKAVESTARGTVFVLERASDGARLSIEIAAQATKGVVMASGTAVAVTVIGTGVLLSVAGEAIAFIPNALGKALLHNERITN